jgi:hypothetical protein
VFEIIASTVSRGGDATGQRSVLPPVQSTTRLVHAAEQEEHEATSQGTSGRVPVAITTTVNNKRNEKLEPNSLESMLQKKETRQHNLSMKVHRILQKLDSIIRNSNHQEMERLSKEMTRTRYSTVTKEEEAQQLKALWIDDEDKLLVEELKQAILDAVHS